MHQPHSKNVLLPNGPSSCSCFPCTFDCFWWVQQESSDFQLRWLEFGYRWLCCCNGIRVRISRWTSIQVIWRQVTWLHMYLESDFRNGANFAISGSSTLPRYVPFSLDVQVLEFRSFRNGYLELNPNGRLGEGDFRNDLSIQLAFLCSSCRKDPFEIRDAMWVRIYSYY